MTESSSKRTGVITSGVLFGIRAYQKALSPFFGRRCRYHPSCSHYTYEAIETYGAVSGSWLGAKRIGRCHPWHEGGFDPVPGSTGALERPPQHSDR